MHPHVASKNLLHFDSSGASLDSQCFYLVLKAVLIANYLGMHEQAEGSCVVKTTSGEAF